MAAPPTAPLRIMRAFLTAGEGQQAGPYGTEKTRPGHATGEAPAYDAQRRISCVRPRASSMPAARVNLPSSDAQ